MLTGVLQFASNGTWTKALGWRESLQKLERVTKKGEVSEETREEEAKKKKKEKKKDGGVGFGCYIPGQCLHRVTQQAGARLRIIFFSFSFET